MPTSHNDEKRRPATLRRVAIVAVSFRLPGTTQALFWEDLLAGRDLVSEVDPARWSSAAYLHPNRSHPGSSYVFAAGSIGDVSGFDASFFGISPREAHLMDPQQRLLLEMSWEAFENCGIRPSTLRGSDCGVYVAISSSDYSWRIADDLAAIDASFATGNTASIAANRLSYFYDLRGPSLALDTACSSSLVAFHQAYRSIITGEISQALVGAISLHLHPLGFVSFSKASMLSKSGRCRVFDAAADGYVRSEGGGVFLLKDYDAAIADGNPILAVVAHSAVNTDGHKSGLTVPSAAAQAALLTRAYQQAGIEPDAIDYIEAHGTGTAVGDPIEAHALGEALAQRRSKSQPLLIGSVKGNVGHLEPASGTAGLVKALYCLQHRVIPAHVGMQTPNPRIAFQDLNLQVVTENLKLPPNGPLVIGVNSFGFGGANAHVILQSHVAEPLSTPALPRATSIPIVLSARDGNALRVAARELSHFLSGQSQGALYDIAYQLVHGREHHSHRAVLFGRAPGAVAKLLQQFGDGTDVHHDIESGVLVAAPHGAAFVYSGNGAQWAGMGRTLLGDLTFRSAVREVDALLSRYADYSVESELAGENGENRYDFTEIAQPALFAVQVGITAMLRHRGLAPIAVAGHSVGEVAAAWASGALSLAAAVSVIHHRSALQGLTKGTGRMSAVSLGETAATQLLRELELTEQLCIAGVNSRTGVSIAGSVAALKRMEVALKSRSIAYVRLDLDYAFHSPAMDGLFPELRKALAHLEPEETSIPFYSAVTGERLSGKALDADYWWRNIREPVQFEPAMRSMVHAGINIYVEIGPHAPLSRYMQDSLNDAQVIGQIIPTGKRGEESAQRIYAAVSHAIIAGATIDWQHLLPWRGRNLRLPNYPWQRERYWHATTSSGLGLIGRRIEHPLLGHALPQLNWSWENELDTCRYPLFADHVVGGATVFPATGYAELALAVAFIWQSSAAVEIEGLEIRSPLLLAAEPSRTVRCTLDPGDGQLTIRSREFAGSDTWAVHAVARLMREPNSTRLQQRTVGDLPTRRPDFDAHSHQRLTVAAGLQYGPRFQAVSHGWVDGDCALALLEPAAQLHADELDLHHLHPALLDCAFQLIIQLVWDAATEYAGLTFIPTRIGHLFCQAGVHRPRYARVRLLRRGPHSLCADYEIYDAAGQAIALLQEVRLRAVRLQHNTQESLRYLHYVAVPKPPRPPQQAIGARSFARLDSALRRCFKHAGAQRLHRLYAREVEPLLDALCERFAVECLQASADQPPDGPFLSHLRATAQPHTSDLEIGSAQDIWNSLLGDYPDFFRLIHAVGCVGVHLNDLLWQRRSLAEVLPAHMLPATVMQPVLGADARQHLIDVLRVRIELLLRDLPEGQRLGMVEISAAGPLFTTDLCSDLDSDRAQWYYMSASTPALDQARRLQERHAGIVVQDLDDVGPAADCSLAIVWLDFRAASQTRRALDAARKRLAPDGTLLVVGQHSSRALEFVYGADPAWWEAEDGVGRASAQFVQSYLQQIGFDRICRHEHAASATCGPYTLLGQLAAPAVAVAGHVEPIEHAPGHWLLLCDASGYSAALADALAEQCRLAGDRVSRAVCSEASSLAQTLSEVSRHEGTPTGIVSLSGLCAPRDGTAAALLDFQVERCALTAALVQACESKRIRATCCLVTADVSTHLLPGRPLGGACKTQSIADAPLAGLARTLMNEASLAAVRLIDLETSAGPIADTARALAQELRRDDEQEIILTVAGARFAPRLRLCAAPHATDATSQLPIDSRQTLGFAVPGQLRNLRWQCTAAPPLADDQVEVAIRATGLNFRDVMYALGLLSDEGVEHGFAGATLGLEFSGVVVRAGAQVRGFARGDAVVGFAPSSFGDRLITPAQALSLLPRGLSFEAAATIPSAFFTAYYALHHLAALQAGEKVLIHGAAGGVGLAAIQVAKWRGAQIFATAGSDEKRDFLHLLGVDHVLDSRSLAFGDQVLQLTGGQGVDVVLNSLAGEAINRNLGVLKPFGRFLELGKRDFYENTRIGLRPFRNNISYFGVDADQLMRERPELTQELFGNVLRLFRKQIFHALPYQAFEARDVIDAFRHMQQSRQIGKIVITYRSGIPQGSRPAPVHAAQLELAADATYLITGGLRGFGLRTAEWLAERGARSLALLGRHGPAAEEAQHIIARLERRGVRVRACTCDVTDRQALSTVIDRIDAEGPPLRGIVHAAAVIDDALIRDLDAAQIRRVLAPKVLGAQHLHELTLNRTLDFFVLYSSATTLFGNPGQGNYIAANSALEALARARRAAGLPATCIRWGAIEDVGFLARSPKLKQALVDRMGGAALPSSLALDVLEQMLLRERSDLGVVEFDWRAMRRFLPSAAASKFAELAGNTGAAETELDSAADLDRMLRELPDEELVDAVAEMLKFEIGEILRIAPDKIDPVRPVQEMGLDSLMGVELVVAVENRFGVRLPVLALSEGPTVAKLAASIVKQLRSEDTASAPVDATRAQIEHIASQHDVPMPSATEVERFATELRAVDSGTQGRMIQ